MKRNYFHLKAFTLFYIVLGTLPFSAEMLADEEAKSLWSVSLKPQWYHRDILIPSNYTLVGGLAVANDTVGVALGNNHHSGGKQYWRRPWKVFVLLYDAKTGKFVSEKGPWLSGSGFKLISTSNGNFLLFLSPIVDGSRYFPGELVLLSASGEQLKELQFDFTKDGASPAGIQFYSSPSGGTVMLAAMWDDEVRYEVLNADNVRVSREWVEVRDPKKREPWTIQISDDQLLGGVAGIKGYYVKRFAGEWKALEQPVPEQEDIEDRKFQPTMPGFLKDRVFIGQTYATGDTLVTPAFREDGMPFSQYVIQKLPDYNYFRLPPVVSQDGRLLALHLIHENKITHWWACDMDMDPAGASYYWYVWESQAKYPIATIKISRHAVYCSFFPQGVTKIVVLDDDRLKVFPLSASSPNEEVHH